MNVEAGAFDLSPRKIGYKKEYGESPKDNNDERRHIDHNRERVRT